MLALDKNMRLYSDLSLSSFCHLCSWLRLAGAVRALGGNEDVTPLQRRSDELSAAVARLTTPLDALIEEQ